MQASQSCLLQAVCVELLLLCLEKSLYLARFRYLLSDGVIWLRLRFL